MLDVSIWLLCYWIAPYIVIRPFTLAEFEENLPDLRVHFNNTRSPAFGLVEGDQIAEKINVFDLEKELLAFPCSRPDCERKSNAAARRFSSFKDC
jgi:hypothetical protein